MKKRICKLLALALCALFLPLAVPGNARADTLYIIPDSSTRALTYSELWDYSYDTLLYAFNEIFARHGYKFETGSKCWNWFTQMPWYSPNPEENSKSHSKSLNACSKLEWANVNLIKQVRADMRAMGTTNPTGKKLPPAPGKVNSPRGFSFVSLKGDQRLPVYTAPGTSSYRANNGKALCNTNGAVYAMGWDSGWMLMLYEASQANQYRVGYISRSAIKGKLPDLPELTWERTARTVVNAANLTDDPALTGASLCWLPAGTQVTYLTTMYNDTAWDYIETVINGQTARGFVPSGTLDAYFSENDDSYGDDDNIY